MSRITILIADDHPVVRKGIRDILDSTIGFEVVGETGNGQEAYEMALEINPTVILLDIELEEVDGIEVTKNLKNAKTETKILILSSHSDKVFISEILSAGASGYLMKGEMPDMIINAIRGVARGETGWLSPSVATLLSELIAQDKKTATDLSPRELQVMEILVTGVTNLEIGLKLGISVKTVEKHLQSIYIKLGVESRVEAAVSAIEKKIVETPK